MINHINNWSFLSVYNPLFMLFLLYCSGVDVLTLLQSIGVSESIIGPLRDSQAGYFAIALAIYKLATPLRYAVTIGNNCMHHKI